MFCMNCGAKLSDTAKFCGCCGAKVEPLDIPVSADPAQATQPAKPVQLAKSDSPAQSPAAATTAATPVTNGAPSFIPNEVNSRAGSFGSDFADRSAATITQTSDPMQSAQPIFSPQSADGIQPVRYSAEIPPAAPATDLSQPAKKKSRLIPGLCIAAGAVVVLGGASAVFYNCNKPLVSKLIMGDAGYAHSVTMNALSAATESSEMMTTLAQQSMSAGLIAAQSTPDTGIISSSSGDGAIDPDIGYPMEEQLGKALELAAWQINHATGTRGVSADLAVKIEPSPDLLSAIKDSGYSDEEFAQVEKLLNKFDFGMKISEKDSGDALEYSADISAYGGSIGNAQLRYEEDGTATLVFPGMSSTGFTAQLPAHSMTESAPTVQFDFQKFENAISDGLKDAFKDFEIKCENGTTGLGTLKFTGMTVQINLDKDDLCKIAMVVIDAARSDEDLISYLSSFDESMTAEKLTEGFASIADEIENWRVGDDSAAAQIVYYINGDNTLAGADFTVFGYEENNAKLRFLSEGNNFEMLAAENGDVMFQAHAVSDSATSGSVTVSFVNESYDGQKDDVVFTVNYSGLGTANVFGMPVPTGNFKMDFSAEDTRRFIEDEMNMDIPEEIISTVGDSSVVLNVAPNGSGIEYSLTASADGLGSFTYSAGIDEVSGDVAPKPGSEYKLVNYDDISEDDVTAFTDDILSYYAELSETNTLVNVVYSTLTTANDILGDDNSDYNYGPISDDDYDFGDYDDYDDYDDYGDYDDYYWDEEWENPTPTVITDADITAANTLAQRMKNNCTVYLAKMDAQGTAPNADALDIYVFAWSKDAWQTYVNTIDDSDLTGYQEDFPLWTDGKDHWGIIREIDSEYVYDPDDDNFTDYVSTLMPDVESGYFDILIQNGKVIGVSFVSDFYAITSLPAVENFQRGSWDFYNSDRAGVANGIVVGTAPVLELESSAE